MVYDFYLDKKKNEDKKDKIKSVHFYRGGS